MRKKNCLTYIGLRALALIALTALNRHTAVAQTFQDGKLLAKDRNILEQQSLTQLRDAARSAKTYWQDNAKTFRNHAKSWKKQAETLSDAEKQKVTEFEQKQSTRLKNWRATHPHDSETLDRLMTKTKRNVARLVP